MNHFVNDVDLKWELSGSPIPPPNDFKQAIVKNFGLYSHHQILIETGTFFGDMVYANKDIFREIYTIELSNHLYQLACKKFESYNHIHPLEGDSSNVLPDLLTKINEPCIFWLDGHYSMGITAKGESDTPILAELEAIFHHPLFEQHIILIDDARAFTGIGMNKDYPSIDYVRNYVYTRTSNFIFEVKADIIRIYQK